MPFCPQLEYHVESSRVSRFRRMYVARACETALQLIFQKKQAWQAPIIIFELRLCSLACRDDEPGDPLDPWLSNLVSAFSHQIALLPYLHHISYHDISHAARIRHVEHACLNTLVTRGSGVVCFVCARGRRPQAGGNVDNEVEESRDRTRMLIMSPRGADASKKRLFGMK